MGNEVTIDNGVATVRPITAENAAAPLAVAGRGGVATVTDIGGLAFQVSEEHAGAAGLVDGQAPKKPSSGSKAPSPAQAAPAGENGPSTPGREDAPSRGASTADWRAFLGQQGIPYTEDDRRDDLVALWENR